MHLVGCTHPAPLPWRACTVQRCRTRSSGSSGSKGGGQGARENGRSTSKSSARIGSRKRRRRRRSRVACEGGFESTLPRAQARGRNIFLLSNTARVSAQCRSSVGGSGAAGTASTERLWLRSGHEAQSHAAGCQQTAHAAATRERFSCGAATSSSTRGSAQTPTILR